MLDIRILCVGKLKEEYYKKACDEYIKRLGAYCKIEVVEISEYALPDRPSPAQINDGLLRESVILSTAIHPSAAVTALCVEGDLMDSLTFASYLNNTVTSGKSRISFIIGGSNGLDDTIKNRADRRLSLSKMTLPHHLARVVLLEQLYRAMNINAGGKYHK